ncbi:proline/glycine betaine ABC transporter permease [Thiospirochaeta perfilievii]|uniref:Proline/glycine betaine ABC transporter permease n=1 Tax=Thiospirochaeta perfilievii TaxID=252967 RepID=A0A5C1Q9J3_9SPIO|nr:proline/glycine betaine ABC transporter permease [Thiospirochaeta perfilievii]QEN04018.1 proline/glycine betaine ABC transporter permease [Thiospirochaeta perfilievii]
MSSFPDIINIPLDVWIDNVMDWLLLHLEFFFDFIGAVILQVIVTFENIFLYLPWFIFIPIVGFLGWKLVGSKVTGIVFMALLFLIGTFGYWELSMRTLSLVITSVFFSLLLGIPQGIIMARSDKVEGFMKPLLDGMQTMPSFVYLIPALMFFGMGKVPAMFATIIYAVPPVIRLTNVGIRNVDKEAVEAALAYGASKKQVLFDVQLPLAKPSIMVGINQTTMMALAMVVIGSMIGAKGLGMEVLLAINRIEVGRGFEAGISIVVLAIIIDRITFSFSKKK